MDSASGGDGWRVVIVACTALCVVVAIELLRFPIELAVVAMLAVAVFAFFEPVGVICAVLVSLPWFFRPISIQGSTFAASELLLVGALAGFSGAIVTSFMSASGWRAQMHDVLTAILRQPLIWFASLLTVVGLLLALRPYNPEHRGDSLREWRWTLLEPLVLVIILVVVARTRPSARRQLTLALIAGATLSALYAFTDLLVGGGLEFEGVTRIAGPYPHPNALALYAMRVAALALGWLAFEPRTRRWLLFPAGLIGAAVVATFSRGALVGMAIAASLALPAIERRQRTLLLAVASLGALALVTIERERMLGLFGGGSGSLRLDIWRSALTMIRDRPIVGYGPDQFLYAYVPRYIEPTAWNERFTAHAHNLILDFWIRLGIIGGAFAIGAMVSGVIRAYHVVTGHQSARTDALGAAASIGFVAALAHGMVDNAYFSHDLAMSGWFLAWLAFAPVVTRREGSTSSARSRRWRSRFHRLTSVR